MRKVVLQLLVVWHAPYLLATAFQSRLAVPASSPRIAVPPSNQRVRQNTILLGKLGDNNDDEASDDTDEPINPYADPNYPDLEFVNYDDPEYVVDQGINDEFFSTEEKVEEMREERRRRNDEYQFQTYFKDVLHNGKSVYKGEWTVYQSSWFAGGEKSRTSGGPPEIFQATDEPLTVVSRGFKKDLTSAEQAYDIDAERIYHSEESEQASLMADEGIAAFEAAADKGSETSSTVESVILSNLYWPEALKARDFRGEQGIMVCGK